MIFSDETILRVNQVFEKAWSEGRDTLYEHEVYQIIRLIGLSVPEFVFCKDPGEVTEALLKGFGSQIVVKIVSPQIAHKQKLGGVRIIRNEDPLYVQFVLNRMREDVLSRFAPEEAPQIKGFLILEFIPFTQALGNEVLIGFKEDPAFGPVITVTKGGDDAEFFAKYFDPANLFLPPFDHGSALKMFQEMNIRHKFEQIGHPEYLEFMAQATAVIGRLAEAYSVIHPDRPRYIIKSFEVNPFVITLDNRFVAVDGFAQFIPHAQHPIQLPVVNPRNLTSFFRPRGIAVVGVSGDVGKYSLGREISHLLHDLGRNDLYFVNAKGGTVTFGADERGREYRLYPKITDIEEPVELAVYAAPAQYMIDFVRELNGTSVKAVILISGIPAEIKYQDFEAELTKCLPDGLRVIGPNCMGIFAAPDPDHPMEDPGLNTLFLDEQRLEVKASRSSNCVLLTQSGAFSVTAIDKMQHARVFQSIVSFGNKFDVKVTDLLAYFADLASIDVLSFYLEGLDPGEGRRFFQLARTIAKPIIVYKAGRTEAGAKAAASHTASMSGSYDVFQAACRQAGIILAENISELYDLIKVFSLLSKRTPAGNRIAGVVNAGFESTVGADELQTLRQAQLSPKTSLHLQQINKSGLVDTTTPFLDITPMADDQMYADFLEAVLQDDGVDCVFVAVVPHSPFLKTTPDTCRDVNSLANLLVQLNRQYQKPMVVSVNAGRYYQDFVSVMEENGLPVYTEIRSAIKALDTFVSFHIK